MSQPSSVAHGPACGFDRLYDEPWRGDSASDEICPCCGIQFGYDDSGRRTDEFYADWRTTWVANGSPWFSKSRSAPDGWSAAEQLATFDQCGKQLR